MRHSAALLDAVSVYDVTGKRVAVLADRRLEAGPQSRTFTPYPEDGGPPREASFWMKDTPIASRD